MATLIEDEVLVAAAPEAIRAMLHDPEALGRVLPGCESLDATGADAYSAVLGVRIGFMTVRADATANIDDGGPGQPVRLAISGRPRGLVGSFHVDVPFELTPEGEGTRVAYRIDLKVSGRLAAFGSLLMRDATKRQINDLVANIEREGQA
jgi:2-furoyl-CoA dehydrogenase large subunit